MRRLIVLALAAATLAVPAGASAQIPDLEECMPYLGDCARVTVDYVLATEDEVVDRAYNLVFGPPCACSPCQQIWGEPCHA